MNTSNRIASTWLLVMGASALSYLLFEVARANHIAGTIASAQRQHDALRQQAESAAARARALTAAQSNARQAAARRSPASGAAADAQSVEVDPAQSVSPPSFIAIAINPKLRALWLKKIEDLDSYYGEMRLAALQLRPEQLERLRAATVELHTRRLDLAAAGHSQRLTIADPGIKKMNSQLTTDFNQQLDALLGPVDLARWRAEMSAPKVPQQPLADWIATRVSLDDAPITLQQGRELARILSENTTPGSLRSNFGVWARAHRVDWDAAVPQIVRAGFSPAQIAVLDSIIEEKRSSAAVTALLDAAAKRYPGAKRADLSSELGYYKIPGLPPRRG